MSENIDTYQNSAPEVKKVQSVEKRERNPLYASSEFARMQELQGKNRGFSAAIFTDIDNTFYREDRKDASMVLAQAAMRSDVPLVAVTGNDIATVQQRIASGQLPQFQIIIGAVGTEIAVLTKNPDGTVFYGKDTLYEDAFQANFPRRTIVEQTEDIIKKAQESMPGRQIAFQHANLEEKFLQGENPHQPYKVSCNFFADSEEKIDFVRKSFQANFPNQKIIISEEIGHNGQMKPEDTNKKYNIDVVPATKADAIRYVQSQEAVDFAIVAGDSGNDADMLTNVGNVAILVGGAKQEAKDAIVAALGVSMRGGSRSFTRVSDTDKTKFYYQERNVADRLGPQSILHALRILLRFGRRFHLSLQGGSPSKGYDEMLKDLAES